VLKNGIAARKRRAGLEKAKAVRHPNQNAKQDAAHVPLGNKKTKERLTPRSLLCSKLSNSQSDTSSPRKP
jgi:hypothetical protein